MEKLFYTKHSIDDSDIEHVVNSLNSGWLTQGPSITDFENLFKEYVGADYALAVNNGTTALQLAAAALGVGPGQKVLVTPLTFVASANCVLYQGADVEFVDIDPDTMMLSLDLLENKLSANPDKYAGIVVVDFAGLSPDMERLSAIAKKYGKWVIEDASHAPGASFLDSKGNIIKVGSGKYSDVVTFSFHPAKHIACGEGGMVTTNSEKIYSKMVSLRTHGIEKFTDDPKRPWLQDMKELGFNFRMADINAALGISQLRKLPKSIEDRNILASRYEKAFAELKHVKTPKWGAGYIHALHLYVVQAEKRDDLFLYLRERGINCQIHYVPIYRMSYYQNRGHDKKDFPSTEEYFERCISLPMYNSLSFADQDRVISEIYNFYQGKL